MPSSKSAKARLDREIKKALERGDSYAVNEMTANVMVGTTLMIVFFVMVLCLILNEVGIFSADKTLMRWAVLAAAVIEVPITLLNAKYLGTKPWLKLPLMIDLTMVCGILSATLGHNVTLAMVFPVLVSTRYFDVKYTKWVAAFSVIIFAAAAVFNGYFGIMNLNMVHFPGGAELAVAPGMSLRDAILAGDFHRGAYVKSLLLNDFIPRILIFIAMCSSCCYVASRGKRMIENETENARNTARIETELDLATRIQVSMLPCLIPAFPGHEDIQLYAVYHAAKEVGGDFYDYFIIDQTHVGVVIADVAGKGVGAALFMTISKTVLKNQLQLGLSPEVALTNANRQLCENNDAGLFVTCWAGVFDTETNKLQFVNAGHNPPVMVRKGQKPEYLKQKRQLVLAGMEGFRYNLQEIQLAEGDEMIFYTDGVTEAINADKEMYGEKRLLECIEGCRNCAVDQHLEMINQDIDRFVGGVDQFDDITIMAMRITK